MRLIGMGVLLCGLAAGCQSKLHDENKALWEQNRELQSRVDENQGQAGEVSALQGEVAARDAKIAELENQLRTPTQGAGAQPGIEGIETSYNAAAGELTVNLPGDVLFDSGRATLKESAKATLNKVAQAIKGDYSGKQVRVEGHSDSDPIQKTKGQWQDNRHLSMMRALEVTRYLASQGVPEKQILTSGFGDTKPKGNNKQASRRVEIVVVTR